MQVSATRVSAVTKTLEDGHSELAPTNAPSHWMNLN
jgi:hypothetical protein